MLKLSIKTMTVASERSFESIWLPEQQAAHAAPGLPHPELNAVADLNPGIEHVNAPGSAGALGAYAVQEATVNGPAETRTASLFLAGQAIAEETPAAAGSSIAESMEDRHYAKPAPRFTEQMHDTTRTNTFSYVSTPRTLYSKDPKASEQIITLSEHEGLKGLHGFLTTFLQHQLKTGKADDKHSRRARGILENLTFIGEKEYQEAAEGLAMLWKSYLDADPGNQLCVPTKISEQAGKRKSDVYLFERVLATFSDDELEAYSGRIVTQLDKITEDPAHCRIVLLDDWTVSGAQMRDAYADIAKHPAFGKYADSVEINLITASREALEHGLPAGNWDVTDETIPVKAYYQAHEAADTAGEAQPAPITGTYSSVDCDFEIAIAVMKLRMEPIPFAQPEDQTIPMPPLTNVVRTYRYGQPLISVNPDGTISRNVV